MMGGEVNHLSNTVTPNSFWVVAKKVSFELNLSFDGKCDFLGFSYAHKGNRHGLKH